ncbi:MAG: mechanosensitive ion channel family protein [Ruminococcaceae bacterium]|nr:mechanosensitive ion channel family protein [Oscillospiraceae bacterium]
MNLLTLAADTAETHEVTLNETVHDLIEKPEETLSAFGSFFRGLGSAILAAIPTIILALIVLIAGLLLSKLTLALLSKGLSKTKLELTVTKFTTQMAKIVMYVLLITIVLNILGIPATSIITVIGTAGVAIGLALQNSLSNVAGGFLLMITKPFKIGDYIITNGVEGTVSQISILHTRLNSGSNQAIFVPNGLAVNAVIVNNNGNDTRRVDMTFSISYNDDFETAQGIILGLIEAHPLVLKDKEPLVRMKEHGGSAIIIAARAWCNTSDYWTVYFDLTEQTRAAFLENGIEIPFEQLDVHLDSK